MHYILSLSFNADDLSTPLTVAITGVVGGPPEASIPPGDGGNDAGAVYTFQRNDTLAPQVRAGASPASETQVKISGLSLAATHISKKKGKRLSPFNKFDACAACNHWGVPQLINVRNLQTVTTLDALQPLTVTARKGKWSIAGYLSVLIEQRSQEDARQTRPHLFSFSFGVDVSG